MKEQYKELICNSLYCTTDALKLSLCVESKEGLNHKNLLYVVLHYISAKKLFPWLEFTQFFLSVTQRLCLINHHQENYIKWLIWTVYLFNIKIKCNTRKFKFFLEFCLINPITWIMTILLELYKSTLSTNVNNPTIYSI